MFSLSEKEEGHSVDLNQQLRGEIGSRLYFVFRFCRKQSGAWRGSGMNIDLSVEH